MSMLNLAIGISRGIQGRVSQRLYWLYALIPSIPQRVSKWIVLSLVDRVSYDAEVVELRLPEDHRIQVKSPEDIEAISRKVCKPILHEVVDGREHAIGCRLGWKGSHLLAIYDGPWVYYCELQAEEPAREGPPQ